MDPATAASLGGMDFNSAANAGVNLPPLFAALAQRGATPEQIQQFGQMLSDPSKDWAGQFGKYAHGDTMAGNLDKFLSGAGSDQNVGGFGADAGHGGWLQKHLGDVMNVVMPGSKTIGEMGNRLYDWQPDWVRKATLQNLIGDQYSRHIVGALIPGGGNVADYFGARDRGVSAHDAMRQGAGNLVRSGSYLAAGYGAVGGAAAGGSGILGSGVSTGSTLGNAAVNGALSGAASGSANAALNGGDVGRAALTGAATGAIGAGAGGIGGAIGGTTGRIAGSTLGGAASGAVGAALNGGDVGRAAGMGAISGLAGSAGAAAGGAIGDNPMWSTLGRQIGQIGGGYVNGQLFAPQQAQQPQQQQPGSMGLLNQPVQMPGGGLLMHAPTTGTQQTMPAYTPTLPPGFAQLYGQDQAQRLLAQMRF